MRLPVIACLAVQVIAAMPTGGCIRQTGCRTRDGTGTIEVFVNGRKIEPAVLNDLGVHSWECDDREIRFKVRVFTGRGFDIGTKGIRVEVRRHCGGEKERVSIPLPPTRKPARDGRKDCTYYEATGSWEIPTGEDGHKRPGVYFIEFRGGVFLTNPENPSERHTILLGDYRAVRVEMKVDADIGSRIKDEEEDKIAYGIFLNRNHDQKLTAPGIDGYLPDNSDETLEGEDLREIGWVRYRVEPPEAVAFFPLRFKVDGYDGKLRVFRLLAGSSNTNLRYEVLEPGKRYTAWDGEGTLLVEGLVEGTVHFRLEVEGGNYVCRIPCIDTLKMEVCSVCLWWLHKNKKEGLHFRPFR